MQTVETAKPRCSSRLDPAASDAAAAIVQGFGALFETLERQPEFLARWVAPELFRLMCAMEAGYKAASVIGPEANEDTHQGPDTSDVEFAFAQLIR